MLFVLTLLGLMAFWQRDFLITGISANVFLNSAIFGTFFFGVYAAFSRIIRLDNDVAALKSLQEEYTDAISGAERDLEDPIWRYYRCQDAPVLFSPPVLLGYPYTILSEEIAATKSLTITTGVMQNLLDNVDEKLDEGRSLINYVTGLLVFLGLIGTFIGLMVTLGSVGAIIGGLDLSGGAGAEAIQKLMDDLMIPLQGMATGFSSSLFGLITSLALGLVALFGNKGADSLKSELGTWLAGVARVTADTSGDRKSSGSSAHGPSDRAYENMMSVMYRVARLTLVSNARTTTTVEATSKVSQDLALAQTESQRHLGALSEAMCDVAHGVSDTRQDLDRIAKIFEDHGQLSGHLGELTDQSAKTGHQLSALRQETQHIAHQINTLQSSSADFENLLARRDQVDTLSEDLSRYLKSEFARFHGNSASLSETLRMINQRLEQNERCVLPTIEALDAKTSQLREEVDAALALSQYRLAFIEDTLWEDRDHKIEAFGQEARSIDKTRSSDSSQTISQEGTLSIFERFRRKG